MKVAFLHRLGSGKVDLGIDRIQRTVFRYQLAAESIHGAIDQPARRLPGFWNRAVLIHTLHEGAPHRCGMATAYRPIEDLLRIVQPEPDGCQEVGREAGEPYVALIIRRARFAGRRDLRGEPVATNTESSPPVHHIAQNREA